MKRIIKQSACRVAVALGATLCTMFAAPAQVVSLDTVVARVEANNPMLKQYDLKAQALREYSAGATSWMAPMVGAGTFMTPYPGQQLMDERDKGSVMISVEQSIPNPARQHATRDYMSSRAAVEGHARSAQFNVLRAEAKTLYYAWIAAEKKMRVLRDNERLLQLMIKLGRLRYGYNQGSLANLYKTEGRLQEVQNMLLMTQSEIDEKRYRLKTLMNMDAQAPLAIDTSYTVAFTPFDGQYDTAAIGARRSDIMQIDKTIETMRLNQRVQRYQAKPDFKIRFDHMQPIGDMPTQFTAMAMVSIPIAPWSSRMYKAEVKGMQYDIAAMQTEREARLLETRGMLAGMSAQLAGMQRQLDNYNTRIVPALRNNYETVMVAYEENRDQLPSVLDAWEAMNMAQMEYLQKLEDYYNMIVRYEEQVER